MAGPAGRYPQSPGAVRRVFIRDKGKWNPMGCRRQPRLPMTLTATVCGMDAKGRSFLDRVRVVNLSRDGAMLEDSSCAVSVGDTVALRCEGATRRFRVIWAQSNGEGRQIGLAGVGLAPMTGEPWLPASSVDDFLRPRLTLRREYARYVCEIAVEMRLRDVSTPMWVTASDFSEGGCRVQVPHAMTTGTEVSVALWLNGERVWVLGDVTHCVYGCGTGIRFKKLDRVARERIASLVHSSAAKVSDRRDNAAQEDPLCAAYSATS